MTPPKILPPHYFFIALVAMVALSYTSSLGLFGSWALWAGLLLMAVGLFMAGGAAMQFSKADTNIVPLTESAALVTQGMFAFSRNPMYSGMFAFLIGTGFVCNEPLPWIVLPAFFFVIRQRFVVKEELLMEETFGDDYVTYKNDVRRWL